MDMLYAKQKIDAGADFAITQMFFENRFFYQFMERVNSSKEARKIGLNFTARQCEDLWRSGVRRFHFYTLNRSEAVTKLLHHLGLDKMGTSRFTMVANFGYGLLL
jgi:methylenetetrahydrofolate reductase (NADPH)